MDLISCGEVKPTNPLYQLTVRLTKAEASNVCSVLCEGYSKLPEKSPMRMVAEAMREYLHKIFILLILILLPGCAHPVRMISTPVRFVQPAHLLQLPLDADPSIQEFLHHWFNPDPISSACSAM